jgi:hypothetical protein
MFLERQVLSFHDNEAWFKANEFEIEPYVPALLYKLISEAVRSAAVESDDASPVHVAIDISSMSRPMAAQIVFALSHVSDVPIDATFVYSPAKYSPRPARYPPVTRTGPVIPEYAGWSVYPERPPSAIFGLGYEYGRALGALEYLDPMAVWAFVPRGGDKQYEHSVERANKGFYEIVNAAFIHRYRMNDPFDCFRKLESLAYGLLKSSRPVLVPFGPKIFALNCLLAAELWRPHITVWRVSAEQDDEPVDRVAVGRLVKSYVSFANSTRE